MASNNGEKPTGSTPVNEMSHAEAGEVASLNLNPSGVLHRKLKSRHMQMIAFGGAIGAGLFIASGSALYAGRPGSLMIGYIIVGIMILFTLQALAEMTVLFPVNGAFYTYFVRFIDPSWGFAMGWDYAISWLSLLPFELIAACVTIEYWNDSISMAVWVSIFWVFLVIIQFFGVRGYGEVEFVLCLIKLLACVGFILFGIVTNCGGIDSDDRGYIGARYWRDPGAFKNGFNGFAAVFVAAAFSFGGTELVGLAAAEADKPQKAIPKATKQVIARICIFYLLNLFILTLILPSDDDRLLGASGANSAASPFVLAIKKTGVLVLPSIFNAVITISVISVANSCAFGSSRTLQAMAQARMAPQILAYVDAKGRPVCCLVVQLACGLVAYIGLAAKGTVVLSWLLSLTGLCYFMIWASICLAHIRLRVAWAAQGFTLAQIPYRAPCGIYGSYIGLTINILCLMAIFYNALYPTPGATPNVEHFFNVYLAAPVVLSLYLGRKLYKRDWSLYIRADAMDLRTGASLLSGASSLEEEPKASENLLKRLYKAFV